MLVLTNIFITSNTRAFTYFFILNKLIFINIWIDAPKNVPSPF
jgi:hypothetical protein